MNTDKKQFDPFSNLSETIVAISKAGAYDILVEQVKELKQENERLKKEAILQVFSEWLKDQNVTKVNKATTGNTFARFIEKYTTDNYSHISLVINKFEKANSHE